MLNNQREQEPLLPPPELLKRYNDIRDGLADELVNLVKKEQEHRHNIQKKYLLFFKLGQISGIVLLSYCLFLIYDLVLQGKETAGYTLLIIIGLMMLLSFWTFKNNRKNFSTNKRPNNHSHSSNHNFKKFNNNDRRK